MNKKQSKISIRKLPSFLLLSILFLILSWGSVQAQNAQQRFEEVPVQYHNFKWQQISTPGFEIFYYKGGENLAKVAAKHVEQEYLRICELLGYYNFEKMKLVLYLNEAQKSQSNINKGYFNNPSGGDSYYVKNLAEVSYPGTMIKFKKELSRQIANSVVNEMLYGRGVKEIIRSSHFIRFPGWISDGLPAYLANGWTVEMDGYMYHCDTKAKATYLNGLNGDKARLVGQSVWNYIVEEHGPITIANIMLLLRSTREIDLSVSGSVDRSYNEFLFNWHKFYQGNRQFLNENFERITPNKVESNFKVKKGYSNLTYNPDHSKVAFSSHKNGYLKVLVYDTEKGKKLKKFKKRTKSVPDSDQNETLIRWRNKNDLRVLYRSFGEYSLFYNISKNKGLLATTKDNLVIRNILAKDPWNKKKLELPRFDNIENFNYSPDGEQIVFSASSKGISNLYIMLPRMKKMFKVTNDVFDDIDASFVNDDKIIFASNRINDSSGYKGSVAEVEDNYDLYLFEIASKKFSQLTSNLGHETLPKALNDSTIYYLNDNSGVRRIHKININTGEEEGALNSCSNIDNYFFDDENSMYAMIPFKMDAYQISNDLFDNANSKSILQTRRQVILEKRTEQHRLTLDTSRKWLSTLIDTSSNRQVKKSPDLAFSIKKTLSSFRIDPIFGSGLIGGVTLTDMFENYRVEGQVFALTDFSSTIVNLDFEGRSWKLLDWKLGYARKNVFFGDENQFSKYGIQQFNVKLNMPFMSRIALTAIPSVFQTSLSDVIQFTQPVNRKLFGGFEGKITFNNTFEKKANRLKGTRAVLSYSTYFGLISNDSTFVTSSENFSRINLDVRNYKSIFGNIIWANRFAAGNSFGNAPKNYIFGGMDNWFFPRMALNEIFSNGTSADLFYTSYVTNMRGFGYNARNGNSFFMYNTEIRIPLNALFGSQIIRSGFLNNMQLNLFSDFGSAWTGSNPFTKDNSFNREVLGGGGSAFEITVLNYRNPIVMGYGFGLRTIVFGSYVKADVGFGLEDYQGSTPMIMISLGNDF